jgi:probable rRNA maturation factor
MMIGTQDMEINVTIDGSFDECPAESWLRGIAEQVLLTQNVGADAELGLMITSQERVRELNSRYRGEDRDTDVLAFHMKSAESETSPFVAPPDGMLHLGEVVISYPQAVMQAQEHRHPIQKELAILIIHGVLHLLGYDHERVAQKREMMAKERTMLSNITLEQEGEQ